MLKLIRDIIIGFLVISLAVPMVSAVSPENNQGENVNQTDERSMIERIFNFQKTEIADSLSQKETTQTTEPTEATETTEVTESTEATELTNATEPTEPEEPESYFDANITYTSEYVNNGKVMNYLLFSPSTSDSSEKKPLVIWLHGSGELSTSESVFRSRGLPKVISNWQSEGFDAYILCPHMAGAWNTRSWKNEKAKDNLENLILKFIDEYNIDTDNITIIGHSLGGQGALYMAHELSSYFARCVVLSGYESGINNSEITIPTIGFAGTRAYGEDQTSIYYMEKYFVPAFGEENYFSIDSSHGAVPDVATSIDNNENGRSDLVEWMLGELETFTN